MMATCPDCGGSGEVRDGDGEPDECVFCGGVGSVDIPEGDDWDRWADDVNRGIEAHRERNLDW